MSFTQGYGSSEIYYENAHLLAGDMPFAGQIMLEDCVSKKVTTFLPEAAKNIQLYAMHKGKKEVGVGERQVTISGWERVIDNNGKEATVYTSSTRTIPDVPHARMFLWINGERIRPTADIPNFEKDDEFDNYHLQYKLITELPLAGRSVEFKAAIWNYHAKMEVFEMHITAELP